MSRFYKSDGTEVNDLREARKVFGVPSITTVINGVAPSGYKFLDYKRIKEIVEDEVFDTQDKIDALLNPPVFETGTLLHEAAQTFWETGIKSDPLGCPVSTRELFAYLKGIKKPFAIEEFYYSMAMETGGRPDLLSGKAESLRLSDYKTVSKFKGTPEKSWLAQLGGYSMLLRENELTVTSAEIIQFSKKNEGIRPLKISAKDLKYGQELFLRSRALYKLWIGI